MQLNPQESFVIARGLEDHTDNTAFYVRAVIRNAQTDSVIDTVNLTNQGDNHRYSYSWRTPADTSGNGLYILITTSVYTDAGYTTKSTLYGDKYDTYLVQQRMNPILNGGGGEVDYKKIQKMIDDAVKSLPQQKEQVVQNIDTSKTEALLGELLEKVSKIQIPQPKDVDLSAISSSISDILNILNDKERIESEKNELASVIDTINETISSKLSNMDEVSEKISSASEKMRQFFTDDIEEVKSKVDWLKKTMNRIEVIYMSDRVNRENEE